MEDGAAARRGLADLRRYEFFGAGVDTGTAAFFDASAIEPWSGRLARWSEKRDPEITAIDAAIIDREPVNVVADKTSGWNLIIFDCGLGDGSYPVWIGRNDAGLPIAFVADLEPLSNIADRITD